MFIYSRVILLAAALAAFGCVDDVLVSNDLVAGFNLVSYPFSTERQIRDMQLTNGTAGANYAASDKITAWDPDAQQYVRYYYRNNARAGVTNKWVSTTNEAGGLEAFNDACVSLFDGVCCPRRDTLDKDAVAIVIIEQENTLVATT